MGLHIEEFSANTGLYTQKQFEAWSTGIQEASFKEATTAQLAYRLCVSSPNCAQQRNGNWPLKYKLDTLRQIEQEVLRLTGSLRTMLYEFV